MKTWLSEDPGKPVEAPRAHAAPQVEATASEATDLDELRISDFGFRNEDVGNPQSAIRNPQSIELAGSTGSPAQPEVAEQKKRRSIRSIPVRVRRWIAANPIWRTQGFWLGGTGVGLAMFAQKTLTVDHQVLTSIRWYALAIFVMLVAWLGTYKNKSLLAEPVRPLPVEGIAQENRPVQVGRGRVPANVLVVLRALSNVTRSSVLVVLGCLALYFLLRFPFGWVWAAPWPLLIFLYAVLRELYGTATANIVTPLLLYVPLYSLLGWAWAIPLPLLLFVAAVWYEVYRHRSRVEKAPESAPVAAPPAPPAATPPTTLPVRSKRPAAQPQTTLPVRRASDGRKPDSEPGPLVSAESTVVEVEESAAGKIDNGVAKSDEQSLSAPSTWKAARFNPRLNARQNLAAWRRWTARYPFLAGPWPRYVIALLALGLNWYCANLLRKDYFSWVGGWGWLLSLVILALAFVRERRKEVLPADPYAKDVEDRTQLRLPRGVEMGVFLAIFLVALGLRLFRLDDWTGAMHGDEGEFGMNALAIVNGDRISPFMTGWFFHPNFSFFGIAAMMKVFGTGLFGLRILSALLGALMVLPFYLLVRMWFGVRMAIIASLLLAFMDVGLYFGKLGLNNIETPFFIVTGLYFFFKGVRSLKTLDFVLAGYAFMLTLYFYFGGRLTPFLVMAVVAYMFLLMPVMRVPGAYFRVRKTIPQLSRFKALDHAVWLQIRGVSQYAGRIILLAIACFCMASPWLVYFQDRQDEMNTRANEKLIFNPNNRGVIMSQSGVAPGPLYLGLRMPTPEDIYPFLPVVFEQTPVSVKLTDDGFWPRVLWSQTTKTLSMFTFREDASSFYTFTHEPAAKPIEAALLILGIAWALWRWRDTRMAVLSMWFWLTIIAGGALTIDAPYMPRLVGLVPALAIFIAIPLNKLSAEFIGAMGAIGRARAKRGLWLRGLWVKIRLRLGVALTGAALGVLLLYLGFQNTYDYFSRYLASQPNREHIGTANFVRWMNEKAASEGRPKPQYFDMASPFFYWGYGINRFLNLGTPGSDLNNPSNELPIVNNQDRDVVFMAWDFTRQYLSVLETYYPEGERANYAYGPAGNATVPFVYFRVKKEQIDAHRVSIATYAPAGGGLAIQREEAGLGSKDAPPGGLQYPVQAAWATNIVAPSAGNYRFSLDAPGEGSLLVDGSPLLTTSASATHVEGDVTLARGPHEVKLTGALADAAQKVTLQWSPGNAAFVPVPRQYLWNGPGKGLLGEVRAFGNGDLLNPEPEGSHLITVRVDGFLGFRHSPEAIIQGNFKATWKGTITAPQPGQYTFSVFSNGDSVILIDGQLLVNNIQGGGNPHEGGAQIELAQGPHRYELRYNWQGGIPGYLEASWTPPGGERKLIGPDVLHTDGGVVDPKSLESPLPPVQLEPEAPAAKVEPDRVIGSSDVLSKPKGIGVDGEGNIYVGDRGNHRVVVFSPDGKMIREWGKAAPEPKAGEAPLPHQPGEFADISDIAVTQDGTVYVFDSAPRVQAFKTNGEYIGSFEPGELGLYGPNGIAQEAPSKEQESAGTKLGLYIGVTGQNRILKLPSVEDVVSGKVKLGEKVENATGTEGGKLEQPIDAVADPSGTGFLYVVDLNNNNERIARLKPVVDTPAPGREWKVIAQWRAAIGKNDGGSRLAISPDGKYVYMSDPDRHRVAVLNIETGDVSYFGKDGTGAGEFGVLTGIAVGPDGKIYVVDTVNSNVQVFSPEKVSK